MDIAFRFVEHGTAAWTAAVKLREDVLRKPLGNCFSKEELEAEKNHYHVVGFFQDQLIATAVLVPDGNQLKMQRVAVSDAYRNRDIGSKMMVFCEAFAREKQIEQMYCHTRDTAVRFYTKNGYGIEGDYFDEDGIPHTKMTKPMKS